MLNIKEFEEKFTLIVKEVLKYPNVILFCDEIHSLMGLGGGGEGGAVGATDIIKPYMADGQIQMIGCTTPEEYSKYIEKEKAIKRRMHKLIVLEPNREETIEILMGLNEENQKFFGKTASAELIAEIADMSLRYNVSEKNPARAINMLEIAMAYSRVFNDKNEALMSEDARNAIALKYDLFVSENQREAAVKMMTEQILGQDEAIEAVNTGLKYVEMGLNDPEKPVYSAFLLGPTGTGKTFMAENIAKSYFGSERNLIKLNMGEYASNGDVSKIVGASPSYVGYDEETDLVRSIKEKPSSVVLFDEIEKADPTVLKTLLSILDTGIMKTNKGEEISFKSCIILFTSNIGYSAEHNKATGVGFCKTKVEKTDVLKDLKRILPPEFLNRIDDIITFNSLTEEVGKMLIDRYLKDYEASTNKKFKLNKKDYEEILQESNIEEYGARGLKRALKKQLIKNLK